MQFANPKALVSTDWLEPHLFDPGVAILDASYYLPVQGESGYDKFVDSHIPGAAFFDIDAICDRSASLPHMMPDAATFAEAVGNLGVGSDQHVIVYDRFGLMSAARAWFMFRYFGHTRVSILDGGLRKWKIEGRALEAGEARHKPRGFAAHPHPKMVRKLADVRANMAARSEQFLDARGASRFAGDEEDPWPGRRRGHVPGALNLPYESLLDPEARTFVSAEQVAARLAAAGVDLNRPVVTSCGSGITACVLALALHMLGHDKFAVYDGSWAEWGLPGDTPVETGPAKPARG